MGSCPVGGVVPVENGLSGDLSWWGLDLVGSCSGGGLA